MKIFLDRTLTGCKPSDGDALLLGALCRQLVLYVKEGVVKW